MNTKTAILLAATATAASALTETQEKQLDIIFADVGANIEEYIALVSDSSSGITMDNLPSGLIDIGEEVATNPDDTSYTSLYTEVDIAAVSSFVTKLSWYSSRLEPELESAGVPMDGSVAATTAAAATTTPVAATTTTTPTSSEAVESTTAQEAAESTSVKATTAAQSSAKGTTTLSSTSKKAATSSEASTKKSSAAASTVAAISQITDGQIQASATVEQQTGNGANFNSINFGAGAIAAIAFLL